MRHLILIPDICHHFNSRHISSLQSPTYASIVPAPTFAYMACMHLSKTCHTMHTQLQLLLALSTVGSDNHIASPPFERVSKRIPLGILTRPPHDGTSEQHLNIIVHAPGCDTWRRRKTHFVGGSQPNLRFASVGPIPQAPSQPPSLRFGDFPCLIACAISSNAFDTVPRMHTGLLGLHMRRVRDVCEIHVSERPIICDKLRLALRKRTLAL